MINKQIIFKVHIHCGYNIIQQQIKNILICQTFATNGSEDISSNYKNITNGILLLLRFNRFYGVRSFLQLVSSPNISIIFFICKISFISKGGINYKCQMTITLNLNSSKRMDNIPQVYNNWVRTAIRPSPDDCPQSVAECLLKGKICTLRHVPIISEEEYFQRSFFGQLVSQVQKFKHYYPLQQAHYMSANAFVSQRASNQYLKEKQRRDFNLHLINDHTLQSYDVPCNKFLRENCRLLGYVEKSLNRNFFSKCKKIKKFLNLKKDDSFMNQIFYIGRHKDKSWRFVEKYDPQYVEWVSKDYKDFMKRQQAKVIISRRNPVERRREIEEMKKNMSFMNMVLNFGNHIGKPLSEAERIDPGSIDLIAENHRGDDWGDFARIIQQNRKRKLENHKGDYQEDFARSIQPNKKIKLQ